MKVMEPSDLKSFSLTEHKSLYHEEYQWSLISPFPVLKYLPKHDEYIVYWNGIVMPHIIALNIAMNKLGIFVSYHVYESMEATYNKLYYAGAFGDRQWDFYLGNEDRRIITYLNSIMNEHATNVVKGNTPAEVLSWFNYKNAK